MTASSRVHAYRYRMACTISNHSDADKSCNVIIPIPQDTDSQRLADQPHFSCDASLVVERVFGFQYAVWQAVIQPNQIFECLVTCSVSVSPRKVLLGHFSFTDYQRIPADVRSRYTQSNAVCDTQDPDISALADTIGKGTTSADAYILAVYEHCVSQLSYGEPIRGLYTSREALDRGVVDCGGFCTLALALLRVRGIPARLVSGFLGSARHDPMHVWIEILLPDGTWLPADPSADHLSRVGRDRTKSGHFGYVGSDHIAVSWGCDIPIPINGNQYHAAFLQYPVIIPYSPDALDISCTVELL